VFTVEPRASGGDSRSAARAVLSKDQSRAAPAAQRTVATHFGTHPPPAVAAIEGGRRAGVIPPPAQRPRKGTKEARRLAGPRRRTEERAASPLGQGPQSDPEARVRPHHSAEHSLRASAARRRHAAEAGSFHAEGSLPLDPGPARGLMAGRLRAWPPGHPAGGGDQDAPVGLDRLP